MREKLNENPVAQAALIGVLLLATAFMLMGGMGGGGSEEAASTESATAPTSPTPGTTTVTGSTPAAPAAPVIDPVTGAPTTATAAPAVPAGGIPEVVDPLPLPAPVVSAYESGRVVVLLIVRNGGIEDRIVTGSVRALEADGAVSAFVVPVEKISRYTAITQGVGVNRAPALVVVNPKAAGGSPGATVSYGFQSPQTVVQAVRDAAYQGPEATYNPD